MFSYVLPKRNLSQMLDEVNMKSNQREHQNVQVKRKTLVSSFAENSIVVCSEVWDKKGSKNGTCCGQVRAGGEACYIL